MVAFLFFLLIPIVAVILHRQRVCWWRNGRARQTLSRRRCTYWIWDALGIFLWAVQSGFAHDVKPVARHAGKVALGDLFPFLFRRPFVPPHERLTPSILQRAQRLEASERHGCAAGR